MNPPLKKLPLTILIILLIASLTGCAPQEKTPLTVFAAGSLIVPLYEIETAFEETHPDVDVYTEFHGSIQVLRHNAELHEPIDVVISADHALIPMLMYNATMPDTDIPYADWHLKFAGNRMALAYTENSKYADEINEDNWYEILSRDDVRIGLSDPRFDASGYRTLILMKLAEQHYQHEDIFTDIFGGQFITPIRDFDREEGITILVPEILDTHSDSKILLRGSSIMLLSLLDSGDIDYALEYESVVAQHNLLGISLPDEINMGSAAHEADYQQVKVLLDFQRFATVKPEFSGELIAYGLTIPANAAQPDLAAEYIQFLLSEEGQAIMEANHHPLLDSITANGYEKMPASLQSIAQPGD
jgi:molybdate/tungstate transport system substrate-binding protein